MNVFGIQFKIFLNQQNMPRSEEISTIQENWGFKKKFLESKIFTFSLYFFFCVYIRININYLVFLQRQLIPICMSY